MQIYAWMWTVKHSGPDFLETACTLLFYIVSTIHKLQAIYTVAYGTPHRKKITRDQLRQRPHDRILAASDDTRNFIHRLLHRNVY